MDDRKMLKLKTILNQTFNNDNGINSLLLIKELSGYDMSNKVITSTGDLSALAMAYNEGRRDIYLELRRLLSSELLAKIEKLNGSKKRANNNDKKVK
jgi:hypothetical protein